MDQQHYPNVSPPDMHPAMYTNTSQTPSYSSLDVIDDMLSTPAQLDWVCDIFCAFYEHLNELTFSSACMTVACMGFKLMRRRIICGRWRLLCRVRWIFPQILTFS